MTDAPKPPVSKLEWAQAEYREASRCHQVLCDKLRVAAQEMVRARLEAERFMSDLVSIMEKIELATWRASKAPWTDRGNAAMEALARELAKIIKEHRQLPDNAGDGEV